METTGQKSKKMVSYVASREHMFTRNGPISVKSETGEISKYGSIKIKNSDKGSIIINNAQNGQGSTMETSYKVKSRKGTKGVIVVPTDRADDDTVTPTARGWFSGMWTTKVTIVVDGTVYCMVRKPSFMQDKLYLYKAGRIDDIMNDKAAKALIKSKGKVDKNGIVEATGENLYVGSITKDGLFKTTYSMSFVKESPTLLPALAQWLNCMWEQTNAGRAAGAAGGVGGC